MEPTPEPEYAILLEPAPTSPLEMEPILEPDYADLLQPSMDLTATHYNLDRERLDRLIREGANAGFNALRIAMIANDSERVLHLPRLLGPDSHRENLFLHLLQATHRSGISTLTPHDIVHSATLTYKMDPREVRQVVLDRIRKRRGAMIQFVKRDGSIRDASVHLFSRPNQTSTVKYLESGERPEWRSFDVRRVIHVM